jgi:hypothetical protein
MTLRSLCNFGKRYRLVAIGKNPTIYQKDKHVNYKCGVSNSFNCTYFD